MVKDDWYSGIGWRTYQDHSSRAKNYENLTRLYLPFKIGVKIQLQPRQLYGYKIH